MSRKDLASDDEPTSRRRTAEMLRRLRELKRQARMLKARIDAARTRESRPHFQKHR
jgi:hypothetical protein